MVERISPEGKAPSTNSPSYTWAIVVVGLLFVVGSGLVYTLNETWVLEAQAGAGLGLSLLFLAVLLRPDVVRSALSGRPIRYGSNAAIKSLAFLAILGLLNFLGLKYTHEVDLTETREFTLSEQTIQVLRTIDRPVQILGFFQASDGRLSLAENYLERYGRYTDKLTYEFYDPNVEPALARSLELSNYGLVFISGNNRYETSNVDEQTITSGLMRVTSHQQKGIYFVKGHGGYSLQDSAPDGYSMVKQALERENYRVHELNLATRTAVPTDTQVLVLPGAKRYLTETETDLLTGWIKGGGKLLILVDPMQAVPVKGLLHHYGLSLMDGFVVDMTDSLVTLTPDGLTQQVTAPMVSHYPFHEITRGLNGARTFFPFVRPVHVVPTGVGKAAPILTTSHGSWIETNLESPDLEYNEGVDLPGPATIGVAVEDERSGARLVVFGNGSFISNQNLSSEVANEDLLLNVINWLAEEDELISIRPKAASSRQIFLTPWQQSVLLLTTLVIMPLTVLAAGVTVWWKQR